MDNIARKKLMGLHNRCLVLEYTGTKRCTRSILIVTGLVLMYFFTVSAYAEEKVYRAAIDSDGVQRVEIVGDSYSYDPNHIIVKAGVPVELTFRKIPGITPHNMIIHAPEAGIEIKVDMKSEPQTVTFTALKTGKFPIYCDKRFLFFKNHREKGMEGVLEVVE